MVAKFMDEQRKWLTAPMSKRPCPKPPTDNKKVAYTIQSLQTEIAEDGKRWILRTHTRCLESPPFKISLGSRMEYEELFSMSDIVVQVVYGTRQAVQNITCNEHACMQLHCANVPYIPKIHPPQGTPFNTHEPGNRAR